MITTIQTTKLTYRTTVTKKQGAISSTPSGFVGGSVNFLSQISTEKRTDRTNIITQRTSRENRGTETSTSSLTKTITPAITNSVRNPLTTARKESITSGRYQITSPDNIVTNGTTNSIVNTITPKIASSAKNPWTTIRETNITSGRTIRSSSNVGTKSPTSSLAKMKTIALGSPANDKWLTTSDYNQTLTTYNDISMAFNSNKTTSDKALVSPTRAMSYRQSEHSDHWSSSQTRWSPEYTYSVSHDSRNDFQGTEPSQLSALSPDALKTHVVSMRPDVSGHTSVPTNDLNIDSISMGKLQ